MNIVTSRNSPKSDTKKDTTHLPRIIVQKTGHFLRIWRLSRKIDFNRKYGLYQTENNTSLPGITVQKVVLFWVSQIFFQGAGGPQTFRSEDPPYTPHEKIFSGGGGGKLSGTATYTCRGQKPDASQKPNASSQI